MICLSCGLRFVDVPSLIPSVFRLFSICVPATFRLGFWPIGITWANSGPPKVKKGLVGQNIPYGAPSSTKNVTSEFSQPGGISVKYNQPPIPQYTALSIYSLLEASTLKVLMNVLIVKLHRSLVSQLYSVAFKALFQNALTTVLATKLQDRVRTWMYRKCTQL